MITNRQQFDVFGISFFAILILICFQYPGAAPLF